MLAYIPKIKRSICKIQGVNRPYNWTQPFLYEHEYESGGTAFFVDAAKTFGKSFPIQKNCRYLLTNFHVVSSYVSHYALLEWPERNKSYLTAEVIYVAPNLDVAILKIDCKLPQPRWWKGDHHEWLESIKNLNLDLTTIQRGNSQLVKCIGFPNLQSDYQISDGSLSSRGLGMLSCDLSLNSGNSGGPLFACKTKKVIGICTASVSDSERLALAIPIQELYRFFNYWTDYQSKILRLPCWGISTLKLTHDYMAYKSIDVAFTGALVKSVIKNQACDTAKLKAGDILVGIESQDEKGNTTKYKIDNHGQVDFCSTEKKIKMDTVEFMLNLDPNYLYVHYYRNKKLYKTQVQLRPINFLCRRRYPSYEVVDYTVFGSMVFSNLHLNMLENDEDDEDDEMNYDHGVLHRLQQSKGMENIVVVTHVNPQSYVTFAGHSIEHESILKVNRIKIRDIEHLSEVLDRVAEDYYSGKANFVVFESSNNKHVFNLDKLSQQEREDNEKLQLPIVLRLLKNRRKRRRMSERQ